MRSPLEIIVAWDGESTIGLELARSLFAWLTGNPDNPIELGPDIPVSFRTPLPSGEIPDISWNESTFCVVLLLVDDAMVAHRERWEDWLGSVCDSVAEDPDHRGICSVALTKNFSNLYPALSAFQAIRLVDSTANRASLELEFRARVANEVCRLMDPNRADRENTKIFLSHAKRDGLELAEKLRDYVKLRPAGEIFYDAVDLRAAERFEKAFRKQIGSATVVVLMTDAWATRYWCQWEALQGKELRRPTVIVDLLTEGERRHFPYVGNAPVLRCDPNDFNESALQRIVAAAQLETLRDLHEAARLSRIGGSENSESEQLTEEERLKKLGIERLTRAPELATLLPLMDDGSELKNPQSRPHTFLYPDPPIALHEKQLIRRYDAKINVLTLIEYISGARCSQSGPKPRIVSVSISDSPNLQELGFEHAHLDRLWVALNRHLLALGFGVAYGGDLRSGGYTEILLDLVCAYADEGRALSERLVHWFVAWPIHLKIDDSVQAELSNVIKLHRVDKPDDVESDPKRFVGADADPYAWIRSLTEMRKEMVRETQARILVGGQRRASTPRSGIAEEFVLSLKDNQPIYLCGGFGGTAADLAQVVQGGPPPESLTQAYHADSEERQKTIEFYNRSVAGKRDPIDYAAWVQLIQEKGVAGLGNGLTPEENQRLFTSHSVDEIVGLIRKGLLNVGL